MTFRKFAKAMTKLIEEEKPLAVLVRLGEGIWIDEYEQPAFAAVRAGGGPNSVCRARELFADVAIAGTGAG